MKQSRNLLISIITRSLACVVLLVIAGAIMGLLIKTKPQPQSSADNASVPRIVVFEPEPVEVRRRWEGFGTARAMSTADIPARVSATVESIPDPIEPGFSIDRGDVVAQLDSSDFVRQQEVATENLLEIAAQLARLDIEETNWTRRAELAIEDVRLAQAQYDRVKEAFDRRGAIEPELDQARQALIAAERNEVQARESLDTIPTRRRALEAQQAALKSSLRLAEQNVERARIVSPISGVIDEVDIEVGENLQPGQRVARVVNLTQIETPVKLPASARPHIRTGDTVELRSTGGVPMQWDATIARIAPGNDEETRTFLVYALVEQAPDAPTLLAPGTFVRAEITSRQAERRYVVPRRAIQDDQILFVQGETIARRPVEIEFQTEQPFEQFRLTDRHWVVLRDPLEAGTSVVVTASRSLEDGMSVVAVPVEGEPAP